jgi:hypothetical protein
VVMGDMVGGGVWSLGGVGNTPAAGGTRTRRAPGSP